MRELAIDNEAFAGLAAEVLGRGGTLRFRARGSSMWPAIRDGDVVTVRPAAAAALRVGDVALYRMAGGRPAVHRVVRALGPDGRGALETRGDAALGAPERVRPGDVCGSVVSVARGARVYDLERGVGRATGRLWAAVAPARARLGAVARVSRAGVRAALARVQGGAAYRARGRALVVAVARVRPATGRDAAALAAIHAVAPSPDEPDPTAAMAHGLAQLRGWGDMLVAAVGGAVVGAATVRRFPPEIANHPDWWLFDVRVRRWARGLGLGESLTRAAITTAAAAGAATLRLVVRADNAPAVALYRKLGFAPGAVPGLDLELAAEVARGLPRRVQLERPL